MAGMGGLSRKGNLKEHEAKMKRWKYAIQSMTAEERTNPETITSSRTQRIAKGCGVPESEVRELLSNYNKIKKMMKQLNPAKMKRGGMGGLFRQMGMKF